MANAPDFRPRNQVDITGIARLIAGKKAQEEQIRAQRNQEKQQRFQNILQAAQVGADFAQQASVNAQRRQQATQAQQQQQTVERLATSFERPADAPIGPLLPEQAAQGAATADAARLDPQAAAEARIKEAFPKATPQGTPPKSIESFYIGKVNRGEMSIEDAVAEIQKAEPNVFRVVDNQGNVFEYNKVTKTKTPLTGQKAPSPKGKTLIGEFTPNERKSIDDARSIFNANPAIIENKKAFNIIGSLRELVKARPKGAIGITLTQQAKFAGELGRLTDEDIKRNAPTPDIAQQLIALKEKWISGRITEVASERLQVILDIVQNKKAQETEVILNETLDSLQLDITDSNRSALRTRIGAGLLSKIDKQQDDMNAGNEIDNLFSGVK